MTASIALSDVARAILVHEKTTMTLPPRPNALYCNVNKSEK